MTVHYTDGSSFDTILTEKTGTHEDIMKNVTNLIAPNNLIAFFDTSFSSKQFALIKHHVKWIEFDPIEENVCEENKEEA